MTSTPSPEREPDPETEPQSNVEPEPEWSVAFDSWGPAWELHCIGFGCLFFLLAVYSIVAIVRLRLTRTLTYKNYFSAINSLVIALGLSRALYLWINPYETYQNVPKGDQVSFMRIIFVIAFPCETSAFCLVQFALFEVSKIRLVSPSIQNIRVVLSIILLNFVVAIATAVLSVGETVSVATARATWVACEIFFIVWGLILFFGYLYAGGKIIRSERTTLNYLSRNSDGGKNRRSGTAKVARVSIATAALGLGLSCLQIYSVIAVYELYKFSPPRPWPWWSYQTCFRLLEFLMGCTLAYSVSQRWTTRHDRRTRKHDSTSQLELTIDSGKTQQSSKQDLAESALN